MNGMQRFLNKAPAPVYYAFGLDVVSNHFGAEDQARERHAEMARRSQGESVGKQLSVPIRAMYELGVLRATTLACHAGSMAARFTTLDAIYRVATDTPFPAPHPQPPQAEQPLQ